MGGKHFTVAYNLEFFFVGNEVSGNGIGASVSASQYAIDTMTLHTMVQRVYKAIKPKPLIIAPGGFFDAGWFKEFLAKTSGTLNVVSHHIYNLGAGIFPKQELKPNQTSPLYPTLSYGLRSG